MLAIANRAQLLLLRYRTTSADTFVWLRLSAHLSFVHRTSSWLTNICMYIVHPTIRHVNADKLCAHDLRRASHRTAHFSEAAALKLFVAARRLLAANAMVTLTHLYTVHVRCGGAVQYLRRCSNASGSKTSESGFALHASWLFSEYSRSANSEYRRRSV